MPIYTLRPVIKIEAEDPHHAVRLFDMMAIEENDFVKELTLVGVEDEKPWTEEEKHAWKEGGIS